MNTHSLSPPRPREQQRRYRVQRATVTHTATAATATATKNQVDSGERGETAVGTAVTSTPTLLTGTAPVTAALSSVASAAAVTSAAFLSSAQHPRLQPSPTVPYHHQYQRQQQTQELVTVELNDTVAFPVLHPAASATFNTFDSSSGGANGGGVDIAAGITHSNDTHAASRSQKRRNASGLEVDSSSSQPLAAASTDSFSSRSSHQRAAVHPQHEVRRYGLDDKSVKQMKQLLDQSNGRMKKGFVILLVITLIYISLRSFFPLSASSPTSFLLSSDLSSDSSSNLLNSPSLSSVDRVEPERWSAIQAERERNELAMQGEELENGKEEGEPQSGEKKTNSEEDRDWSAYNPVKRAFARIHPPLLHILSPSTSSLLSSPDPAATQSNEQTEEDDNLASTELLLHDFLLHESESASSSLLDRPEEDEFEVELLEAEQHSGSTIHDVQSAMLTEQQMDGFFLAPPFAMSTLTPAALAASSPHLLIEQLIHQHSAPDHSPASSTTANATANAATAHLAISHPHKSSFVLLDSRGPSLLASLMPRLVDEQQQLELEEQAESNRQPWKEETIDLEMEQERKLIHDTAKENEDQPLEELSAQEQIAAKIRIPIVDGEAHEDVEQTPIRPPSPSPDAETDLDLSSSLSLLSEASSPSSSSLSDSTSTAHLLVLPQANAASFVEDSAAAEGDGGRYESGQGEKHMAKAEAESTGKESSVPSFVLPPFIAFSNDAIRSKQAAWKEMKEKTLDNQVEVQIQPSSSSSSYLFGPEFQFLILTSFITHPKALTYKFKQLYSPLIANMVFINTDNQFDKKLPTVLLHNPHADWTVQDGMNAKAKPWRISQLMRWLVKTHRIDLKNINPTSTIPTPTFFFVLPDTTFPLLDQIRWKFDQYLKLYNGSYPTFIGGKKSKLNSHHVQTFWKEQEMEAKRMWKSEKQGTEFVTVPAYMYGFSSHFLLAASDFLPPSLIESDFALLDSVQIADVDSSSASGVAESAEITAARSSTSSAAQQPCPVLETESLTLAALSECVGGGLPQSETDWLVETRANHREKALGNQGTQLKEWRLYDAFNGCNTPGMLQEAYDLYYGKLKFNSNQNQETKEIQVGDKTEQHEK